MRTLVLLFCCFALVTTVSAQSSDTLALDSGMTVNEQILADQASGSPHAVYSVAPGQFYAFDGRMDLTFPVEIVGPDNGWIKDDATPPVLVTLPDEQGLASRQFFEIQEGGSLVLKNLLMSGLISTPGEIVGNFTTNTGGTMYMAHNVAFLRLSGSYLPEFGDRDRYQHHRLYLYQRSASEQLPMGRLPDPHERCR